MDIPGDVIDKLPTDQTIPSNVEIGILDTLFREKQGVLNRILDNSKDVLIVGLIYILFSLPYLDTLIQKFIPSSKNSIYLLILFKTIGFCLFYFIVKNWYLSRKK